MRRKGRARNPEGTVETVSVSSDPDVMASQGNVS